MFFFVFAKMRARKGLTALLLLGCLLLTTALCCIPLYTEGLLQRLLVRSMEAEEQLYSANPARLTLTHRLEYAGSNGHAAYTAEREFWDNARLPGLKMDLWERSTLLLWDKLRFRRDEGTHYTPTGFVSMAGYEKWITVTAGRMPEPGRAADGAYEVLIQANAQEVQEWSLGGVYQVRDYNKAIETPLTVRVVGLYEQTSGGNLWDFTQYENFFLIDYDTLRNDLAETYRALTTVAWVYHFDYTSLSLHDTAQALKGLQAVVNSFCVPYEKTYHFPAETVLAEYAQRERQLRLMLWGLAAPILVMLALYQFMLSQLIVASDAQDMAVLNSRGGGAKQIFTIYLLQSLVLCGTACFFGPHAAWLVCKVLGGLRAFCGFGDRMGLPLRADPFMYVYAFAGFLFSMGMLLLPVRRGLRRSVVEKMAYEPPNPTPLWQKLGLDFICLAVALYGCWAYQMQQDALRDLGVANVLSVPVDPLLFLLSSLFILGATLTFVRFYPLILRLVFRLGRRFWSAPAYSALLTASRCGPRERFLMLFLALVVAIGVHSGTTAATVNFNAVRRLRQDMPVDGIYHARWHGFMMEPEWNEEAQAWEVSNPFAPVTVGNVDVPSLTSLAPGRGYREPSFSQMIDLPGVTGGARVQISDQMISNIPGAVTKSHGANTRGTVMVFDPAEFSRVVHPVAGLLPYDVGEYLRVMYNYPQGILVSEAYRDKFGLKEGDKLTYYVYQWEGLEDVKSFWDTPIYWGNVEGEILAFVPSWPGLDPAVEGQEFFVIANWNFWRMFTMMMPYQYWVNLEPGTTAQSLITAANDNYLLELDPFNPPRTYEEAHEALERDPLLQGMNAGLTLFFLMAMVTAFVGYGLYWVMSVQRRELQFGIFRSMGMTKGGVLGTLLLEQLLLCVTAVALGVVIGSLTGRLYAPLLQIASVSLNRTPPFEVFFLRADYRRLYLWLAALFASGLVLLAALLSRLRVDQVIKLGED